MTSYPHGTAGLEAKEQRQDTRQVAGRSMPAPGNTRVLAYRWYFSARGSSRLGDPGALQKRSVAVALEDVCHLDPVGKLLELLGCDHEGPAIEPLLELVLGRVDLVGDQLLLVFIIERQRLWPWPWRDAPQKRSAPSAAALPLRPPRLGLSAGFLASASARAWFSVSRRVSTSRRAAGLIV